MKVTVAVAWRNVYLDRSRQMLHRQLRAGTQQDRLLDDIVELTDVARPRVGFEGRDRRRADAEERLVELVGESSGHGSRQGRDIADPLPQRRQVKLHDA